MTKRGRAAVAPSLAIGGEAPWYEDSARGSAADAAEDDAKVQVAAAGASGADEPLLLTVPEAARTLCIGHTTMRDLIARREIPVVRIGRCVRIRRHDLDNYIAHLTSI